MIFTDITHLKQNNKMVLSLIGLEGEPSYIDIEPIRSPTPYKDILTKRERQVFQLLARNLTSGEIAAALHISASTVSTHRKSILRKTNTSSVLQLVQLGLEKG